MEATILLVFGVVYLGMILGGLPFLSLDRTGIALLGAIALIGAGALSLDEAWQAIHVPTLILLFAFMVVSAQLRMGGFYNWITHRTGNLPLSPPKLLAALIVIVAALSAAGVLMPCAHRRSGNPGDPGHFLGLALVAPPALIWSQE